MRAAALLSLAANPKDVAPFRLSGVDLITISQLNADDRFDAALIFGGDGTVHRHLRALHEARIPVLVVPVGSGNDFHCALGLSTPKLALAAWQKFVAGQQNVRAIDLGSITPLADQVKPAGDPVLYCCVAGAGFDSEANRLANAMPAWLRGHGGYAIGAIQALFTYTPPTMNLTFRQPTDQDSAEPFPSRRESQNLFIVVGNGPSYGNGMRITPRAALDDGMLDLCIVRQTPRLRVLWNFYKIYFGNHLELDVVEYHQICGLRLQTERPVDVYADGDYVCQTPVEITVKRQALRVIV